MYRPWMKEEKGIIHRERGANLRCPVSTAVQFSLRDEITGDNIYRCQSVCPVVLKDFEFLKKI